MLSVVPMVSINSIYSCVDTETVPTLRMRTTAKALSDYEKDTEKYNHKNNHNHNNNKDDDKTKTEDDDINEDY